MLHRVFALTGTKGADRFATCESRVREDVLKSEAVKHQRCPALDLAPCCQELHGGAVLQS